VSNYLLDAVAQSLCSTLRRHRQLVQCVQVRSDGVPSRCDTYRRSSVLSAKHRQASQITEHTKKANREAHPTGLDTYISYFQSVPSFKYWYRPSRSEYGSASSKVQVSCECTLGHICHVVQILEWLLYFLKAETLPYQDFCDLQNSAPPGSSIPGNSYTTKDPRL
jgi:hypothetical protein